MKNQPIKTKLVLMSMLLASLGTQGFAGERIEYSTEEADIQLETVELDQLNTAERAAVITPGSYLPGVIENRKTGERVAIQCDEVKDSECAKFSFYKFSAVAGQTPVKLNQYSITQEQVMDLLGAGTVRAKRIPFFGIRKMLDNRTGSPAVRTVLIVISAAMVVPILVGAYVRVDYLNSLGRDNVTNGQVLGALSMYTGAWGMGVSYGANLDVLKSPFLYSYVLVDKLVRKHRTKVSGKLIRVSATDANAPFEKISNRQFKNLVGVISAY